MIKKFKDFLLEKVFNKTVSLAIDKGDDNYNQIEANHKIKNRKTFNVIKIEAGRIFLNDGRNERLEIDKEGNITNHYNNGNEKITFTYICDKKTKDELKRILR